MYGHADRQTDGMGGHQGKNLLYHVSNVRACGQTDGRDGWTPQKRPSALSSCRIPYLACGCVTYLSLDVTC